MSMNYGKIHVKIHGLSPLLMNRLNPESLKEKGPSMKERYIPEEEARNAAYITKVDGEEQLYIPSYAIYAMLVNASGAWKAKGKRAGLSSLLAGTIRIEPEKILMGHCNYEIDERPVIINRARVLAWRPKIPEWEAEFNIIYNKRHITPEIRDTLKLILDDGGTRLGLLDYRPQHKGWFGTFEVTKYEVTD